MKALSAPIGTAMTTWLKGAVVSRSGTEAKLPWRDTKTELA